MKCCSKFPDSIICARCFQYAVVEHLDDEKSIYVTYSVKPYKTFCSKTSVKVLHVVDCTKSDEFRNFWVKVQKTADTTTANFDNSTESILSDFKANKQPLVSHGNLVNSILQEQEIYDNSNCVTNNVEVRDPSQQTVVESKVVNSDQTKDANDEKLCNLSQTEKFKVSKCSVKLIKNEIAELESYSSHKKNKIEGTSTSIASIDTLSEQDIKVAILSSSVNVVLNRNLEEIIASSSKKHKRASNCTKKRNSKSKLFTDKKGLKKETLKRKRWTEEPKQDSDESYEDDIFENQTIRLPDFLENESDSEDSFSGMETPKFEYSVSPEEKSSSPIYEDCYSPGELNTIRKEAEQYNSRRKRRKMQSSTENNPGLHEKIKKQLSVDDALNEVCRILSEKKIKENTSDDEKEDYYFSDSSEVLSSL